MREFKTYVAKLIDGGKMILYDSGVVERKIRRCEMEARLDRIAFRRIPLECNCLCHRGKCNHTSSLCHKKYLVVETFLLTLPGRPPVPIEHQYEYDNYRTTLEVFNTENLENLLAKQGFRVFKYVDHCSEFYSYTERITYIIEDVKDCYVLENVPYLFRRPPIYSNHSDSISEFAKYILVPPDVSEAEWTVIMHEVSNVPHNYLIPQRDPETGEEYSVSEQCWGRREEWIATRYYYQDGRVESRVLEKQTECDGPCCEEVGRIEK